MSAVSNFLTKILAATVFALAVALSGAQAQSLNVNGSGVAVEGYDPVAYFDPGEAIKGKPEFSAQYNGVSYWFSSEANRDTFKADPEKYIPAYGGFCAYGVAQGAKAPIDPAAFTVVNGKLYLNLNKSIQNTWNEDIPGYIEKADKNWPGLGG